MNFLKITLAILCSFLFPRFLPRASQNGAVTLINASGYAWGVPSDETAINIETFEADIEPEFKTPLEAKDGTVRAWAVAPAKMTVTMDAEVGGSTGLMAATFFVAFAPVNSITSFGAPTTGLYLDKATVTLNRSSWKKVKATLTANAGVA